MKSNHIQAGQNEDMSGYVMSYQVKFKLNKTKIQVTRVKDVSCIKVHDDIYIMHMPTTCEKIVTKRA